jgi:HlyD family secretion protein
MKKLLVLLLVVAALAGAGYWYVSANSGSGPSYKTAKAERARFIAGIGATGILQPEDVIDVGAQVNGRIERFGADPRYQPQPDFLHLMAGWTQMEIGADSGVRPIDYGSPVEVGTILAQLDPALFLTQVESARADLARAEADLVQKQASMELAAAEMERAQLLLTGKANAQADYDLARSNFFTAKANIKVSEAAIKQTQAALKLAEVNLAYTTIRSPAKGVIIDRRVNIGQTVVASLNAPSLFLIAKDLKRMQVWASVNEADIGQVRSGQKATFTVDAYPNKVFDGKVAKDQPRLNATMTSNVVTYTVVIDTDNSDLTLLPYLTANVQFEVATKENALLVPNAALRWKPPLNHVAPADRDWYAKQLNLKKEAARLGTPPDKMKQEQPVVWVQDGQFVRPIKVKTGLTDGTMTEILAGELETNMDVIIREDRQDSGVAGGASPFTPSMFGGAKKKE